MTNPVSKHYLNSPESSIQILYSHFFLFIFDLCFHLFRLKPELYSIRKRFLGLSWSYDLIKAYAADIKINLKEGAETEFRNTLPFNESK